MIENELVTAIGHRGDHDEGVGTHDHTRDERTYGRIIISNNDMIGSGHADLTSSQPRWKRAGMPDYTRGKTTRDKTSRRINGRWYRRWRWVLSDRRWATDACVQSRKQVLNQKGFEQRMEDADRAHD